MKIRNIVAGLLLSLVLTSCYDNDSDWGNSNIMFGNVYQKLDIFDADITEAEVASQADSVVSFMGVYRSGAVEELDAVTVKLKVDGAYLQSIIDEAEVTEETERTDIMKRYMNSVVMPEGMISIPSEVTIPAGDRKAVVPVTLKMSQLKLYENSYLNYSFEDYRDASVPKNKMLVLCIKITETSKYDVLEDNRYCYLEVIKCLPNL